MFRLYQVLSLLKDLTRFNLSCFILLYPNPSRFLASIDNAPIASRYAFTRYNPNYVQFKSTRIPNISYLIHLTTFHINFLSSLFLSFLHLLHSPASHLFWMLIQRQLTQQCLPYLLRYLLLTLPLDTNRIMDIYPQLTLPTLYR